MIPNRDALFGYLLGDLYGCERTGREIISNCPADFYPGAETRDVFKLRLANSFYKKLVDSISPDADEKCLAKFLASNDRARTWFPDPLFVWEEEAIGEVKRLIENFFHPNGEFLVQSTMDLAVHGRLGPGASVGANGTDFYTKLFSSELTATSYELYSMYLDYIQWFPDWGHGEFDRLTSFGLPAVVRGNVLSFVRKTRDISRSICTEPTLNMFFQLGFGEIIGARLRQYFGIDLGVQPERNRELALSASLSDRLVTIDLESASDSMSLRMCDFLFPESFMDLAYLLRSPYTKLNGEELRLYMISTMGNGFTFPLQTCLFASVVVAAASMHNLAIGRADAAHPIWGVFGDDIVCPREISGTVCRLLSLLGFVVNGNKSYFTGPFRESCGVDAYKGVNVRGVYLKTLLEQESRYVAINLLNDWVCRSGIRLDNTIGYLTDSVRYLAVPRFAPPDSGIWSDVPPTGAYNSKRQRYYYRRREPVVECLTVDDKDRIQLPSSAFKRLKRRRSSLPGLYLSFIGGYIRDGKIPIGLRQGESPSYRTVQRVSPYWGPDAPRPPFAWWP